MSGIEEMRRNWEGFAESDPFWAILTDAKKKYRAWTVDEFFLTGVSEMEIVFRYVHSLGLSLDTKGRALDFGCGVGRLTQAMSEYIDNCIGVDISPTMIEMANELNRVPLRCSYLVNESQTLPQFPSGCFSFIYSSLVLQHIEEEYAVRYLKELIRVLQGGGILIFQIADRLVTGNRWRLVSELAGMLKNLRGKVRLRTRIRRLLVFSGIVKPGKEDSHSAMLREFTIKMHCVPESTIRDVVQSSGARVFDVQWTNSTDSDFDGRLRYLEEETKTGHISKQYCVVKAK